MPTETKISTEAGTAKLETEWTFEILNFRELPDQCLEARKEEIEKAVRPWLNLQIKSGIRNLPGCRVFEISKLKTRTK